MEKILIHTSWGPSDPTRAGLAFTSAMVSSLQGLDVSLFLFHDAVILANEKMHPKVFPIGPPPISDVIEYFNEEKIKVYVCRPCYELRGMSKEDLIPTAELKEMDVFVALAQKSKVISF